ncbi:MAG TPA: PA14 domain-containing protein, partial [Pirellulales bacterium]|nr:PA14 domain-containing protein [Pirellulales bacterium]
MVKLPAVRRLLVCGLVLASTLVLSAAYADTLIGVNFLGRNGGAALAPTDVAGVVPQANWNSPSVFGETTTAQTSGVLNDMTGSASLSGVTLSAVYNDAWSSGSGAATPNNNLLNGILKWGNPAGYAGSLTWNNVSPGVYNVYVYVVENGGGAQGSLTLGATTYYVAEYDGGTLTGPITFTQATSTTPGTYSLGNYVEFTNVSPDANGQITINGVHIGGSDGFGISATQLQLAQVIGSTWASTSSTDWGTNTNWNPTGVPSGTAVTFGNAGTTGTVDLGSSNRSVTGLTMFSAVSTTIGSTAGNSLVLDNGAAAATVAAAGTQAITSKVILNSNASISLGGASNLTISGAISEGSAGRILTMASTSASNGILYLTNGTNSYTGGTNINGGILNVVPGALGTVGNITFGGGTLQYAASTTPEDLSSRIKNSTAAVKLGVNGNTLTMNSAIDSTNTAGVSFSSATSGGVVNLNAVNTYTGGTTIGTNTTVNLGTGAALGGGGLTVNGGTFNTNGNNVTVSSLSGTGGNITDNAATSGQSVISVNGGATTTYAGNIGPGATRTMGLNISGGSNQTISGTVNLSSNVPVITGNSTLNLAGNNNTFGAGPIVVSSGNTLSAGSGLNATGISAALGTAPVHLTGGTLNLNATTITPLHNSAGLQGAFFNGWSGNDATYKTYSSLAPYFLARTPATTQQSTAWGSTFNSSGVGSNGAGSTLFPSGFANQGNAFDAVWVGQFYAATTGVYTFATNSDDGSTLYIDPNPSTNNSPVVDNSFQQGQTTRTGSTTLTAGFHQIVLTYDQGGGGLGFYAQVQGPGDASLQDIPNALLSSPAVPIAYGTNVTVDMADSTINAASLDSIGTLSLASNITLNVSGALRATTTTFIGPNNTYNVNVASGGEFMVGKLSNPAAVTTLNKTGTGVLTLDDTNDPSFTSSTNINVTGGMLALVGHAGDATQNPLGTATVTLGTGSNVGLALSSKAGDVTFDNVAVTLADNALITAGTYGNGADASLSPLTVNFNATNGVSVLGGKTLSLSSSNGYVLNMAGVISQTGTNGAINVTGGTVNLSAVNTYTGTTTVSGGTLNLKVANAVHNSSSVNVVAGAKLNATVAGALASNNLIVSGTASINSSGAQAINNITVQSTALTTQTGNLLFNPGTGNTATITGTGTIVNNSIIHAVSGTTSLGSRIVTTTIPHAITPLSTLAAVWNKPADVGAADFGDANQYITFTNPNNFATPSPGPGQPTTLGVGQGLSYADGTAINTASNNYYAAAGNDAGDNQGVGWTGTITVTSANAGIYSFGTTSDDGSTIYIDGQLVVNNMGYHGNTSQVGSINLTPGTHTIQIGFFNQGGGKNIEARFAQGGTLATPVAFGSQQILTPTGAVPGSQIQVDAGAALSLGGFTAAAVTLNGGTNSSVAAKLTISNNSSAVSSAADTLTLAGPTTPTANLTVGNNNTLTLGGLN